MLFGLLIDQLTMTQALERCDQALQSRRRLLIGVVNAAKVVTLGQNATLRQSLLGCDLMLADGQSVVWASRLLRRPLPERVTGIDLFEGLLERAVAGRYSVYLLGATDQVLTDLQANLARLYPGLRVAGARNGYFADDEASEVADDIRRSGADMLFLGMSSPKKENFLADFGTGLDVPIQHGVGGSFDIYAGLTRRAPAGWQKYGLEWAFRLLQEPRRMWRRYLTTNTSFIVKTAREVMKPAAPYDEGIDRVIDLRTPLTSARPAFIRTPPPVTKPAALQVATVVADSPAGDDTRARQGA
jgi:exopolysaccharide biosynthesis WecB/TagA/CpsF family protein